MLKIELETDPEGARLVVTADADAELTELRPAVALAEALDALYAPQEHE